MAGAIVADLTLNSKDELIDFLQKYVRDALAQTCSFTLVKNDAYQLVAHYGGGIKTRVTTELGVGVISELIQMLFPFVDDANEKDIKEAWLLIHHTISAAFGCVRIQISVGRMNAAYFHQGELWP